MGREVGEAGVAHGDGDVALESGEAGAADGGAVELLLPVGFRK